MELEFAKSNDRAGDNTSPAPQAEKMALEVYERSYKGTNKQIRVPLMNVGEEFPPSGGGTLLSASDPKARLYMEARQSMGRVITSGGDRVGSGFFLNKDGLFSTDYHVAESDADLVVETGDGNYHRARVVEKDPANDLVLLEVEKNTGKETFKPLKIAPSSELKKDEEVMACGFGTDTVLHCSPGVVDFTLHQKDIKLKDTAPYLNPERDLVHARQHTVNGDSGGLEFRLSDGTVRLIIDMTDNKKNTVATPSERLLELQEKHEQRSSGQDSHK
jgi:hypothetical protein